MRNTTTARDARAETGSAAAQAMDLLEQSATACCGSVVGRVRRETTLDAPRAEALVERLKALADPTRLRLLDLLAEREAPLCVCDITTQFPLRQPTISHHIKLLREAGLVDGEKRGVWSYYWATEDGRRCLALAQTLA